MSGERPGMSGERPGYVRGAAWICQASGLSMPGERPGYVRGAAWVPGYVREAAWVCQGGGPGIFQGRNRPFIFTFNDGATFRFHPSLL